MGLVPRLKQEDASRVVGRFAELHRLEGESGAKTLVSLMSNARYSRDFEMFSSIYSGRLGKPVSHEHERAAKDYFNAAQLGTYAYREKVRTQKEHAADMSVAIDNANLMRNEIYRHCKVPLPKYEQ